MRPSPARQQRPPPPISLAGAPFARARSRQQRGRTPSPAWEASGCTTRTASQASARSQVAKSQRRGARWSRTASATMAAGSVIMAMLMETGPASSERMNPQLARAETGSQPASGLQGRAHLCWKERGRAHRLSAKAAAAPASHAAGLRAQTAGAIPVAAHTHAPRPTARSESAPETRRSRSGLVKEVAAIGALAPIGWSLMPNPSHGSRSDRASLTS